MSVTEVLTMVGISPPNNFCTDYDRWVGEAAHKAIELYIKKDLDMPNLDPALRPRLEAYKSFQRNTGFKPIPDQCEVPRYNELWLYGFTLDVLGRFPDGQYGIVDCKSGAVDPATAIQTAGYQHGLESFDEYKDTLFRRFGLTIGKDGRPIVKEFTNYKDEAIWLSALSICNWIRNNRRVK